MFDRIQNAPIWPGYTLSLNYLIFHLLVKDQLHLLKPLLLAKILTGNCALIITTQEELPWTKNCQAKSWTKWSYLFFPVKKTQGFALQMLCFTNTSVADEVFPNGSSTGHGESPHAVRFLIIAYVVAIWIGRETSTNS